MPLITGIAALAVLNLGFDATSIDPQIDRQFAYVKTPQIVTGEEAATQDTRPAAAPSLPDAPVIAQVLQSKGESMATARAYAIASDGRGYLDSLKGMDRKVTVSLNNVTAADALKWVGKQNVNYVVNLDTLPKSKISLSMRDVPLAEALSAIAEVLGGSWQVKGSTLMFRAGFSLISTSPSPFGNMKMMPGGKAFEFDTKGFDNMKFREIPGFKFEGKVQDPTEMAKMHEEMSKHMQGFKIDKDAMEKMHIELGELGKLRLDGKELSKEQRAKIEKEMATAMKAREGVLLRLKDSGDMKAKAGASGFKKVDGAKLLKSMTDAQKEIMKKQGYLKISDLTQAQREMIFEDPKAETKGDFTFNLNIDGEKICIKN